MRLPLAFVTNGVEEAGHCLKEFLDESLAHLDCHLLAEFYEALYPVAKYTFLMHCNDE
jgi:predicted glycoside hydrolase/deacetylase ChbG (UPF0249 family)